MQRDFLGLQKFFVQKASMPETKNVAESRMHRIYFFYFSWVFPCWRIFQVVVFNDADFSSAHCVGEGRVNVLVVYDYTVIYFWEYFLENRQFKDEKAKKFIKNGVQNFFLVFLWILSICCQYNVNINWQFLLIWRKNVFWFWKS